MEVKYLCLEDIFFVSLKDHWPWPWRWPRRILALASKNTGRGVGLGLEHAGLEPIPGHTNDVVVSQVRLVLGLVDWLNSGCGKIYFGVYNQPGGYVLRWSCPSVMPCYRRRFCLSGLCLQGLHPVTSMSTG